MAQKSTNTAPKLFLVVLIVALIAVAAWYLMPKGDHSKSARATWLKPACCWL